MLISVENGALFDFKRLHFDFIYRYEAYEDGNLYYLRLK